jgi:hypothetical protein
LEQPFLFLPSSRLSVKLIIHPVDYLFGDRAFAGLRKDFNVNPQDVEAAASKADVTKDEVERIEDAKSS